MENGVQKEHGLMRQFVIIFMALYFDQFFSITREDRYYLMYGLYAYKQRKTKSTGATYFQGVWPLPGN